MLRVDPYPQPEQSLCHLLRTPGKRPLGSHPRNAAKEAQYSWAQTPPSHTLPHIPFTQVSRRLSPCLSLLHPTFGPVPLASDLLGCWQLPPFPSLTWWWCIHVAPRTYLSTHAGPQNLPLGSGLPKPPSFIQEQNPGSATHLKTTEPAKIFQPTQRPAVWTPATLLSLLSPHHFTSSRVSLGVTFQPCDALSRTRSVLFCTRGVPHI